MNEKEIDIIELCKGIIKNIHIIFLACLIFGASFFGITKFMSTPTYETSTMIMISKATDSNLNATYANLTKSNVFVSDIIKKLDLDMTYDEYLSKVVVEPDPSSRMINIKVKDTIPERAADIANQTAIELKNTIGKLNKNKILISDKARVPKNPISSNIKKNTAIGIFLGFFISVIYVIVKDITDTRIKSADEMKEYYDIPLIGIIPDKAKGE